MSGALLEPVIGLEIHVQLKTATKMFCGNAAEYGAAPNTHLCPVCLGLPGALPVLNRRAVELGVRAALGLHCRVHPRSVFARKNYFYPDLPKGYQISQSDHPLASSGYLQLPEVDSRRIRIRRIHLEEDTGKSLHDRVPAATALDLNRAGVSLIEIVTEPDLRSPGEARRFLTVLKQALEYLDVSDCNMEEGSLRVDANVSVRRRGEGLGTRTELKNLNSFANVERALDYEIERQRSTRAAGQKVVAQTLFWDAARAEARPLRTKETARDYRYFPEPDLPPLEISVEWLDRARNDLPEMPWARAQRLRRAYDLANEQAEQLTATRELADYYEAVVDAGGDPREAAHWVMGEVLAAVNARSCSLAELRVRPAALAELLALLGEGRISRPIAKRVLARMLETGESAPSVVAEEGLVQVRDRDAIEAWVEQVCQANPSEVERLRSGEDRLMGFFIGQVMRLSQRKANPKQVGAVLRDRLRG